MPSVPRRTALRRFGPELGLATFITVNLVALLTTDVGQTVPFHIIWISLTIAYGFRTWRLGWTVLALVVVCAATSLELFLAVDTEGLDPAELTEVPLMAMLFVANMTHASRREEALARVRDYALEQERLRANERSFLRDASHLLRTPITIARGFTELVQSQAEGAELREETDVILRELDSMNRISNRLLLLTATALDELLDCRPLDVAELLQSACQRWQPAARRAWQVTTEPCPVQGDATLLESAIDALLENAVRHTAEGAAIRMRCSRHGDEVVIDVVDEGEGIDPERLPRLFDRKWDPQAAGERSGTGLGLAIVKAIVTAHGGDVRASSPVGGGAEFTVRLPVDSAGRCAGPGG